MSDVRLDDTGDGTYVVFIDGGDEVGIIVDDEKRTFRVVVWMTDGTVVDLVPDTFGDPCHFPYGQVTT